jgi:hypothetical protein
MQSLIHHNRVRTALQASCLSLSLLLMAHYSFAQETQSTPATMSRTEQEVIKLSKEKWQWMADKDVAKLNGLFDAKSMFVHMGGSWGKDRELDVIKSGNIWYKKADVYATTVNMIGNTAILLSDIDLVAVVGGNEVVNPFMVTEVYINENGTWKMGQLSFSRLMRPVKAKP